ncbi:MAG: phosphodiester glycosidase family protein [Rhodospirillaceae bacterium]|nr:phosphodiester glycosidase family protein [Rhodospirillaceae bacterium]
MGSSRVVYRLVAGAAVALLACAAPAQAETQIVWRPLDSGLELARVRAPGRHRIGDGLVTLVRIDPDKGKLVLGMARFEGGKTRTAAEWARHKRLAFAVNAGLYQDDHMTNVGLMRDGRQVNNPRLNRYRSILAFNPRGGEGKPVLLLDRTCEADRDFRRYETLIQNIRLVNCRRVVTWPRSDKDVSLAVLGMDGKGRLLVAYSQSPHTAAGFARLLLRWPLDLRRAQYLEGGRPAQLYLEAGGVTLDLNGLCGGTLGCIGVSGIAPEIPNVIGVARR